MIAITIQSQETQAALDELTRRCQNMQPVFNEIGLKLHQNIVECFQEEKSPDGINWAALSPQTIKKRRGGGANILRDTGAMFESLGHNATNNYAEVTIGQDYAPWHQFGTENMPARSFFPNEILPQNWETEILEIINNHLQN